jgi:hypothetical protein
MIRYRLSTGWTHGIVDDGDIMDHRDLYYNSSTSQDEQHHILGNPRRFLINDRFLELRLTDIEC